MDGIKEQLLAMAEPEFRRFAASLLPGVDNLLGVRLPKLRNLAKKLACSDWRDYLARADDGSFEEVMLQGMVIGLIEAEPDETLRLVASFVPKLDNWSTCDSFCSGLKIAKRHPDLVWQFLQPYLQADGEFAVRFGVVMLTFYYVSQPFLPRVLALLGGVTHEGYYAKMAVAWALSVCFVSDPVQVRSFLSDCPLDDFTFNKTLQKIAESGRVSPEVKAEIRSMKRR